jgi:membrane fusion protein (multidrug efflux system)
MNLSRPIAIFAIVMLAVACGGSSDTSSRAGARGAGGGRPDGTGGPGAMAASAPSAAVPIQVQPVTRRSISQHLETNGTLEAENEVDIVARTSGPVSTILVEEGDLVRADQLLATIDDREPRNQVAIATVSRDEAKLAFDRAESSWHEGLVSQEAYDTSRSKLDAASAQLESAEIQLAYTEIRAPFDALVVTRSIKLAQYVTPGTILFRVSDFTPLLCRVEVPEKDLPRIQIGQTAYLRVEAFPDERFDAHVARLRPTVDPTSGTFTVTLEVEGRNRLRPGMFASVFLETERHDNALVIPRKALVLDSLGDTVFVRDGDQARRREVELGLRDEDSVEILSGLAEGDELIVLGQDGLADGTPVTILDETGQRVATSQSGPSAAVSPPSEEAIVAMRQRMKERGLSEAEIEARIEQVKAGAAGPGAGPGGGGPAPGAGPPSGTLPPFLVERIRSASPEELERIKDRMRSFGMSDEAIEKAVADVRNAK